MHVDNIEVVWLASCEEKFFFEKILLNSFSPSRQESWPYADNWCSLRHPLTKVYKYIFADIEVLKIIYFIDFFTLSPSVPNIFLQQE